MKELVCRLRFRQLALLAALDDHHNLHRAAAAIHLAQPSATKLVRDLEKTVGFPLFERLPRGMRPTELGAEVLAFAKHTLTNLGRLKDDLQNRIHGGTGQLLIGAVDDAAPDVVACAVAELKGRQPLLSIKMAGGTSDSMTQLLLDGKLDLAVGRFGGPSQPPAVHFEPLAREVLCVVVRREHPLAGRPKLECPRLQSCPWVVQSPARNARQAIDRGFLEAGATPPTNVIECASIFGALHLVQALDAVTLVPESVVRDLLAAQSLVRLPLHMPAYTAVVGILTSRAEPFSNAVTQFIECLRHSVKSESKPRRLNGASRDDVDARCSWN
jgi:DNA-binding transcriptional LysR family regulator